MQKVRIYIEMDTQVVRKQNRVWGYLIECTQKSGKCGKRADWSFADTTRNQAMLIALNEALKRFHKPCSITVYMDNKYISEPLKQKKIAEWQQNGWKTIHNEDIKNVEEWKELAKLMKGHEITFAPPKPYEDQKELLKKMEQMKLQRDDWQQQRLDGGY